MATVAASPAAPFAETVRSAAADAAPLLATVPAAVGSAEFAPSLAVTLGRLARDGVQEARLQLHPAEMGPIDVRIALDGTQARIDFVADVAATRSAIESGLPELASALRESGLTLAGGGVFQQPRRHDAQPQQAAPGAPHGTRSAGNERDGGSGTAPMPAATARAARGVVDLYA
jgi:flagellar hook-length control protein FliK